MYLILALQVFRRQHANEKKALHEKEQKDKQLAEQV